MYVFFYLCVCAHVCVRLHRNASVEVGGNLKQSVLSLQHVGPGDGTDIVSLAGKHLH